MCTSIGNNAFADCSNLTSVSFPVCTSIGTGAFATCYRLATADFPECTYIGVTAFGTCSKLSALYLGASTVCTLASSNALNKTLIASGTGYIYVPSSLVANYQAAKNWSYYSAQISAIAEG